MMLRNLLLAGQRQQRPTLTRLSNLTSKPRRLFSSNQNGTPTRDQSVGQKTTSRFDPLPWVVLTGGIAGFSYLNYMRTQCERVPVNAMRTPDTMPIDLTEQFNERISQTFGWFGYGISTTALLIMKLRHSFVWTSVHPAFWFLCCAGFMGVAHMTEYWRDGTIRKHVFQLLSYTGFTGCMGMMLLPIC